MTKTEALKILIGDSEQGYAGRIDNHYVQVWPADIKANIEFNEDIDIDFIQDFSDYHGDLVHGYSLKDIKLGY